MSINNNEKISSSSENVRYVKTTRAKSTRKNGRFNFIDAILILLILAVITALVMYFLPGIRSYFTNEDYENVVYVIEIKSVESEFVSKIQINDVVYDATRSYKIGTVKNVEVGDCSELVYNEGTGLAEMKQHPELKNITVTVVCDAVYTNGEGYSVNGQRIAVGRKYDLRFPEFSGSGYCVDMTVSKAQ